jgi:hypothetical protein
MEGRYYGILMEVLMFESLDEQMRKDENRVSTTGGRMLRYALYLLAAVAVFAGLIFSVHELGG